MGSGKGGGSQTVTQQSDPWSGQQPYLKQLLGAAGSLFNNTGLPGATGNTTTAAPPASSAMGGFTDRNGLPMGANLKKEYDQLMGNGNSAGAQDLLSTWGYSSPQAATAPAGANSTPVNGASLLQKYYPDSTIANQSPQTQQAIGLLTNRATNGSPITSAYQTQVADTLNGKYLDPQSNPYFKGALNNIADAYARGTGAQTASAFNKAGAYGGSAMQETQAANNQAFANSLNDLGNTQYQQGRQQQLQAGLMAPDAANADYKDIAQLANAGGTVDQRNQDLLNSNISRFNFNQQAPIDALKQYQGLISGNYGSSGSQTTPYYTNTGANALGGAISGGLLGSSLGTSGALGSALGGSFMPWASGGLLGGGLGAVGGGLLGLLSDIRLKDNIVMVDMLHGIPLYHFTYKGDHTNTIYEGVMAQDLLHTHPDAVVTTPSGFYAVDYGKIGVAMRVVSSPTIH
jgi:hypothetical protein